MFGSQLRQKAIFVNEAALCRAFISQVGKEWVCYAESCGFDILMVRPSDGIQIGVEAKMTLNAKVLLQAREGLHGNYTGGEPDFRAALVPMGTATSEMKAIARLLNITVIEMMDKEMYLERKASSYYWDKTKFKPALPVVAGEYGFNQDHVWLDMLPHERCTVPEYVPDVTAGASGPSQLSDWKIKAIKICVIVEKRGYVTVDDFLSLNINRRRFMDMGWIRASDIRGRFIFGVDMGLRKQHPRNYLEIEADYEIWMKKADLPTDKDPEGNKELPL